jgi:hypothetical protein
MDLNLKFSDHALISDPPAASIAASKVALLKSAVVSSAKVPNILISHQIPGRSFQSKARGYIALDLNVAPHLTIASLT